MSSVHLLRDRAQCGGGSDVASNVEIEGGSTVVKVKGAALMTVGTYLLCNGHHSLGNWFRCCLVMTHQLLYRVMHLKNRHRNIDY